MALELDLTETFALTKDGEAVELKNKKSQALLIYLALTDQPQSRTHLATLLWGDRFEEQARSSLRQALYALRKAVGDGVVLGEDRLSIAKGSLVLQEVANGGALEDFRLGEDAFDDWLEAVRQTNRKDAVFAAFEKAQEQEQQGEPEQALSTIRAALAIEPLDEQMVQLELGLLAGLGRRAEALSRYAAFVELLERELDARPDAQTAKLADRIRSDTVSTSLDPAAAVNEATGVNILIAPFEDLGGGDTATFLARDLPTQIVHAANRGVILLNLLPEAETSPADKTPIQRAISAGAMWLLSGSVRQIGSRVRIALTATDVSTGNVVATDTALVDEDEAFEYLDRVSDTVTAMWRSRYLRLGGFDLAVVERLKRARNQPDLFHNIIQETFYQTFYSTYSRASLDALDAAADYALSVFPKSADFHAIKGWAHYSRTDLSDARTRFVGIKTAKSIFEKAILLQPDLSAVYLGLASVNSWLGRHVDTEAFLAKSKVNATIVPVVDVVRGNSAMFCGRNDEAIEALERVLEQGAGLASMANWYATYGLAHFNKGGYETALSSANAALDFSTEYWLSYLVKMAALSRLGRLSEASETVAAYVAEYPSATVGELDWLPFSEDQAKANFLDALRDAGLPE